MKVFKELIRMLTVVDVVMVVVDMLLCVVVDFFVIVVIVVLFRGRVGGDGKFITYYPGSGLLKHVCIHS